MKNALATIAHRYLRIPYALNAEVFQDPADAKATYVFVHGIGNSLHAWDEVIAKMPRDVQIVAVDLLGFGDSPKPDWAQYSAKTQACALARTLATAKLAHRPVLVGHSLGALVSVEFAKRHPLLVREIVLCSPPFYRPEGAENMDDLLRALYRLAKNHPEQLVKMSPVAVKLGLVNRVFSITEETSRYYFAALEASIINQTSLQDAGNLRLPITIFYGRFDPVVVAKNIEELARAHDNVKIRKLFTGHEIIGGYAKTLARDLAARTEK